MFACLFVFPVSQHLALTHFSFPFGIADFHDFDTVCESCDIERGFVEGAPNCPAANCKDTSGNDAFAFLVENGCSTGCSTNEDCQTNYLTLRTVHDSCDHDVLSVDAEEGLHDFEESCVDVVCNAAEAGVDQTVCTATPAGASTTPGAFTLALVVATSLAAVVAGF